MMTPEEQQEWLGVLADALRNLIETRFHPMAILGAKLKLEIFNFQVGDDRPVEESWQPEYMPRCPRCDSQKLTCEHGCTWTIEGRK